MNKKFQNLAQANVDHYNNHPGEHNAMTVAAAIVAVVAVRKTLRRVIKTDPSQRSGQYAK